MSGNDQDLAAELYRELAATEDLPIERTANRWIGEAQAVAREVRDVSSEEVRREGARDVVRLLSEVDGTENERADEHVRRARELAERLAQA
ncbi:hypothetical protein [Halalkalicoccus tibetensis]|uniref:DUF8152 domain-containing protein n=1 Tax=Halalkalicoccus tibetensis TaxID=175632 RepID=A0ABD5V3Q1_9EURY